MSGFGCGASAFGSMGGIPRGSGCLPSAKSMPCGLTRLVLGFMGFEARHVGNPEAFLRA